MQRAPAVIKHERVRAARHRRGLSQTDVARRSGFAAVEISRGERGVREVRITTLVRIAAALDVDPGELLDGLSRAP